MKTLILNTGGTFNKRYDKIKGELIVPTHSEAIERILKSFYNFKCDILNIIHKDSLDFTDIDRKEMLECIKTGKYSSYIVIHGTDTMNKSASFLASANLNKPIIFVGSMVPFSIEKIEATANFAMAVGFLSSNPKPNVYISMHGIVAKHNEIKKNYDVGKFYKQ